MSTSNSETIYFRGDLTVTIKGASNLPNADGRNLKLKFDSLFSNKEKKKDLSDPYVSISIDRHKILQTKVIKDDLNPVWNETFETEVSVLPLSNIKTHTLLLYHPKEKLGHAHIPIRKIVEKKILKEKLILMTPFKNARPTLDIEVVFEPVTDVVGEFEVTRCYFPLRHTGDVRLYQDAHCHALPGHNKISVHGSPYQPTTAWCDIAESIERAQRFIYITGWSMTHTIRLQRDQSDRPTLGDLLKAKAKEGVKVLILLWDEPFNSENEMMSGVVGTNDEITRVFFSKTQVKCVLASRQKSKRGMVETLVSNTSYSHHQKTVICDDSTASCGAVAYLGGLDLTIGRYDDQNHSLFESTKDIHSDDFYQTFPGILKASEGPRQPWHDVHARVTGEAALDVLANFSDRWKVEAPKEASYLVEEPDETKDKGKWRVQIFRSIPIDAAKFDGTKKHTLSSKVRSNGDPLPRRNQAPKQVAHGLLVTVSEVGRQNGDSCENKNYGSTLDQFLATFCSIFFRIWVNIGYSISIDRHKILQTKVIKDDLNPVWNETFETEVSHEGERLYFWVWDDDMVGKEKLGHAHIPIRKIVEKKILKEKLILMTPFKNARPTLDIEVVFEPVTDVVGEFEVTRCYFPLRHTGDVRLYQDAHCQALPGHNKISVHGSPYQPTTAWCDIAESIERAQRFIYITGWSMTHTIRLQRDQSDRPTLGDLLKAKAKEGVKVLILLWDEPFNSENEMMSGVVGTNDEITRVFFSKTQVKCVLASRQKSKRGMVETLVSNTSYSHHQKTVICDDSAASCGAVAYLGGLDLTIGRYDDQTHSLFESTKDIHSDDFYQTFPGILKASEGPRQPWHDVHARVTGEAALDVLANFSDRWKVEAPKEASYLVEEPDETKDKGKWRVQIFRSIPIDAAKFDGTKKHTLSSKHGRCYEASIHRAYVTGVRNSDKFLYVENQYFLGSAHSWLDRDIDVGPRCNHLIPVEIAEQVCEMIEKGRRFAAYILIPLFPEGNPHAAHIQEILYWQAKTMSMMYKKIAKAIDKSGVAAEPTDYLNFFCLGKRETPPASVNQLTDDTPTTRMAKNGRAMIYVHSKAMMVDDIYAVVGSANINQRSMDGRRDTEIAVGCFETGESETDLVTNGHVQGLRKSLWTEHIGRYEEIFDRPESLECVHRVREIAKQNWDSYVKKEIDESAGHLLLYPIRVKKDGNPHAAHIQEILYWQAKTMSMMYKKIAKAIDKAGVAAEPTDYLNFFCLGKRETPPASVNQLTDDTPTTRMAKNGRAMIYVHKTDLVTNGHVQGLRKSLWTEHIGRYEEIFDRPESLECVHRVREIAKQNWDSYVKKEIDESAGHLLLYPIRVKKDGEIKPNTVGGHFPDTTANILGAKSSYLPSRLTVMDGRRDTEIAVGCFETGESETDLVTNGHVQGLRKSLWTEHIGRYEEIFDRPESLECVHRVREIAKQNWDSYVKKEIDESAGHLLLYPIRVKKDGEIKPNTVGGHFPDTTANILGAKSSYLPSRLTVFPYNTDYRAYNSEEL
eukprot:sb/3460835/